MNNKELYRMLELPEEVVNQLNGYEQTRRMQLSEELQNKIVSRSTWEEGIQELKALLDEDSNGIKILWELLHMVCNYSYEQYQIRQIPDEIFVATMKFIPRFLNEHYCIYGDYQFRQAWWFPRQLSVIEFRIGALEYEFVDGVTKEIAVHIPSDADFSKDAVLDSMREFAGFRNKYFPEWKNIPLTCDTWMLAPALEELLDKNSNILSFKNMFEIDETDEDATWFMDWIFPGYETIDEKLPEKTSLQRKAKRYLLSGKKIGVAKGHLKEIVL